MKASKVIPGDEGDGAPPSCTVTYDEISTPVKVLFLVDKSGSNKDNANTTYINDGTDPNKSWRVGSINNLRNALPLDLFSFNITLFRGNYSNLNDGNRYSGGDLTKTLMSGFSNNSTIFNNAMTALKNDDDKGKTPYQAALQKAREQIQADIASDTTSMYSVILVTDGYPDPNIVTKTDCGDRACSSENLSDADVPASIAKVRQFAEQIVNINPSRVNVNTVYYYSANRSNYPVNILKNIASAGRGAFLEANTNSTIDFKNVVRVPNGTTCP